MHWTLPDLLALDQDIYHELVAWVNEADPGEGGEE